MCGLAGFVSLRGDAEGGREVLARMCGLLRHRGPDDEGLHFQGKAALGHRRLSIIDLSGGKQPMGNAEGTVWTVFNGEIYNFPELRAELEKKGFRFRTKSDTEVIIHGYEAWGADVVSHLNGMFAFALWDAVRQRLVLARDRLGKKPLYFHPGKERFLFGSEMKALLADPAVPREVDPAAVDKFFSFGYIPSPGTILRGVHKLRPGHLLMWENGEHKVTQYWDVAYAPRADRSEEDFLEELSGLVEEAVRCRLISDVPLGAFLSGGLDSSVVVGTMARMLGRPVKTFTIGFDEKGFSEAEDARRIAQRFRTDHREFTVKADAAAMLPDLVWHFDEPFGDSSAVPTYHVSRIARQEVTVALSGDGGDELFAGYNSYRMRGRYDAWRFMPRPLRRGLAGPLGRLLPAHAPGRSLLIGIGDLEKWSMGTGDSLYPLVKDKVYSPGLLRSLRDAEDPLAAYAYWKNAPPESERLSRMQYLDTKVYLAEDILMKVDRMSMAVSLETRAPLLDYRLAEFAATVPSHLHVKDGRGKYLLRRLAARFLPPEALAKKKQGFAIPKEQWFRGALESLAREVFSSERFRQRPWFRPETVDLLLREHVNGRRDFSLWIWCLLNFELWHRAFIDPDLRRV